MSLFAQARLLADAVLYEGYVLYPYRSTSRKNHVRWQFGVIAPRDWVDAGGCEHAWTRTECVIEPGDHAHVTGLLRFLQLQHRSVEDREGRAHPVLEAEGQMWTEWDEGTEREIPFDLDLTAGTRQIIPFSLDGGRELEPIRTRTDREVGRFVRERWPIAGEIRVEVDAVEGAMSPLVKLSLRIDNVTPCKEPSEARDPALLVSLVGAHTLLAVHDGAFVSSEDPPEWACGAVATCANVRSWPIMVGPEGSRDVVMASPIILADHAKIADESPGALYDSTEIDEILTLRTMTLTDEEKREARATDPRSAAIIDRVDSMPPEMLDKLHGALRSVRNLGHSSSVPDPTTIPDPAGTPAPPVAPWWDPGADASVNPDTDTIEIAGVLVAKGSRVKLVPGARRADAHDMFLVGKTATVQGVYIDVEEQRYLAITLEDDTNSDIHEQHGRFMYFYPDEVEPLPTTMPREPGP